MEKFFRILKKIFDVIVEMLMDFAKEQQRKNEIVSEKEKRYQRKSSESLATLREVGTNEQKRAAYNVFQERVRKYEDKHATKSLTMLEKIIKDGNRDRAERVAANNIYKRKK